MFVLEFCHAFNPLISPSIVCHLIGQYKFCGGNRINYTSITRLSVISSTCEVSDYDMIIIVINKATFLFLVNQKYDTVQVIIIQYF